MLDEQKIAESVLLGLNKLREPFPDHQISKLPKGTKAQNECAPDQKTNCQVCGGWHHPKIKHLDYVGHAALTDRLLDSDPFWKWEPLASDEQGLPRQDAEGGLWIKLTVCGLTRLGYGNAEGKSFMDKGARTKELIGDALRNAGMRFGAALDLWHKGDLHKDEEDKNPVPKITADPVDNEKITNTVKWFKDKIDVDDLEANWHKIQNVWGLLNSNEQMEVDAQLKDKAPESNIMYKNLLKKYLEYTPKEGIK